MLARLVSLLAQPQPCLGNPNCECPRCSAQRSSAARRRGHYSETLPASCPQSPRALASAPRLSLQVLSRRTADPRQRSRSAIISPAAFDFSDWFDRPEHSDVLLHISIADLSLPHATSPPGTHTPGSPVAVSQAVQGRVKTYYAHALLLDSQSSYLRARLSARWQQQLPQQQTSVGGISHGSDSSGGSGGGGADAEAGIGSGGGSSGGRSSRGSSSRLRGGDRSSEHHSRGGSSSGLGSATAGGYWSSTVRYELVEHVEVDEIDAMDKLLRLMYGQPLPATASTQLLFKCLKLADRFDAAACMDSILLQLADSANHGVIDAAYLECFFDAPMSAFERPAFAPILQACEHYLSHHFGDVPSVICSEELLQQFYALPFPAVLGWAESDSLQVNSENDVVFLLSAWVAAHQAAQPHTQQPSAQQLEQLAHQVRVYHLGPAYLHHVLPKLEWFWGCGGMQHLPVLLSYKAHGVQLDAGLASARMLAGGHMQYTTVNWEGPAAWMDRPRRQRSGEQVLSWLLRPEELQQVHVGQAVTASAYCYTRGLLLRTVLAPAAGGAPGMPNLDLHFAVDAAAMAQHQVPWPGTSVVLLGPVEVKLESIEGGDNTTCYRQRMFVRARFLSGLQSRPYRDIAPSLQEHPQASHILERGVRVQATFVAVDAVMA